MSNMDTKYILGFLALIIAVVAFIAIAFGGGPAKEALAQKYDMKAFAQCLKNNGAVFYGAFWCQHCAETKRQFAEAVTELPYVECSTPDGRGQLPVCIEKKIESYPTWEFKDGSRLGGSLASVIEGEVNKMSLRDLANAAQCPIVPLDGSTIIEPASIATSTASTTPLQGMPAF